MPRCRSRPPTAVTRCVRLIPAHWAGASSLSDVASVATPAFVSGTTFAAVKLDGDPGDDHDDDPDSDPAQTDALAARRPRLRDGLGGDRLLRGRPIRVEAPAVLSCEDARL